MKKHYHFIGVGGVGMGVIASLLAAKGCKISGSDLKESDYTRSLTGKGATIHIGHDAQNLEKDTDFVVYSSAVKKDNPELIAAEQLKIPVKMRAQVLAELMSEKIGITVAGAHGKTTTTSMISCLLVNAGFHPTTAVGGIINGHAYAANLGEGKYFVSEVDESDGSFLFFSPHISVITNVDLEHIDYYGNWDNILKAYEEFIQRTEKDGLVIGCGDDARLKAMLIKSKRNFMTYGFSLDNNIFAKNIRSKGYFSSFDCVYQGKDLGTFILSVPGEHNILNALACLALGCSLSIEGDVLERSLKEFKGAKRRMQFKGEYHGIQIVDDYGHHPTEISATLSAARTFHPKRLIVAFQPHRYTRTQFLMDDFVKSLSLADYLVVTDIYPASEAPIVGVTSEILCEKIMKATGIPVKYLSKEKIAEHLLSVACAGDLVITLGAGDITRISDELVETLCSRDKTPLTPLGDKVV